MNDIGRPIAVDWSGALTPEVERALDKMWVELQRAVVVHNERDAARVVKAKAEGGHPTPSLAHPYPDDALVALKAYIASPSATNASSERWPGYQWDIFRGPLTRFALNPAVSIAAIVKVLYFRKRFRVYGFQLAVFDARFREFGTPTLLELYQHLQPFGATEDDIIEMYCSPLDESPGRDWPDEALAGFFSPVQGRLAPLLEASDPMRYTAAQDGLYKAIACLPHPPQAAVELLFSVALSGRAGASLAQTALAKLEGKETQILEALRSSKVELRIAAARWLAKLRHAPALELLEAAWKTESQDLAKGAVLDALEAIGQPVERYLDTKLLAADATKTVAKGIPGDLSWFPWESMPAVRWRKDGERVQDAILRWMIILAVKGKSGVPGALLRRYCAMFERADREAFGQFVLEAWLAEDTFPISEEEAVELASKDAKWRVAYMRSRPDEYKDDPTFDFSEAEHYARVLPGIRRTPRGSAASTKGMLAVVAACGGAGVATPVGRYLKEFYGSRMHQAKALLAMLAWVDHPSSLQLMLSVGHRFRTKSLQEEASLLVAEVAERKGWTIAELADRTMPTAGFEQDGTMHLSYGERYFAARLTERLTIELTDEQGQALAALPDPRRGDDLMDIKAAKQAFALSKKELKATIDAQTVRLYEAYCTSRVWRFNDWNCFLNGHPIVRRLLQRMVWAQVEGGAAVRLFRPLEDGTITDASDDAVSLLPGAQLCIANRLMMTEEQLSAWRTHLRDYEVAPLFAQLERQPYVLPDSKRADEKLADFEGHMIETPILRTRAQKLGYERSAGADRSWFDGYEKRFPSLGLVSIIEFTGNCFPEEKRQVALLNVWFARSDVASTERVPILLGKVPPLLLSECLADMRDIAAAGTGFDADWMGKSAF